MSVTVVVVARYDDLVVVVTAARRPLHVVVDVVVVARHHHRIVRAMMVTVVVRLGRGRTTAEGDVLVVTRDDNLAVSLVVVADMIVVIGAGYYDVIIVGPCLRRSAAVQPDIAELEERVHGVPPL